MTRMLMALLMMVATLLGSLSAEEPTPTPEQQAEAFVLDLQDRKGWEAALEGLLAIEDDGVRNVLRHIESRSLAIWQDRPVLKVEIDEVITVYGIFSEDAQTGVELGQPTAEDLGRYKEQRKARKAALKALTVIGLKSKNPFIRAEAAEDLSTKQEVEAYPLLLELSESDPDERVRRKAAVAVAMMTVDNNTGGEVTDDDRVAAASVLSEGAAFAAIDRLKRLTSSGELSSPVLNAYKESLASIERQQTVSEWTSHIFSGFSFASILLLMALGLAITFGLMGVINMAHGEMLMIGCVSTWACYEFIGKILPTAWFDWYYVIAFPISFLSAALVGLVVENLVLRWLYKRPLDSMLATIGISFILIQAVRKLVGDNLAKQTPSWFSGGWEVMTGVILPYNRLFIIALSVAAVLGVMALFRYTRYGLLLRATVQNREVAQAMGINTRLIDMTTFALGSGLAGLAGWAIFLNTNPQPGMGQTYIVDSFLVTVTGGVGNLMGVVISALGIGGLTKILEPISLKLFSSSVWAWIAVLFVVIIFLMRRPGGLFPSKGRLADQADKTTGASLVRMPAWSGWVGMVAVGALGLVLIPLLHWAGVISPSYLNKLGYVACFAIMAIGMDLLWGFTGAMSLCQALFFAIGAYCMGFYLINTGPQENGIPDALKVVMSDVSDPAPPMYLSLFTTFGGTVLLGVLLSGLAAFLVGMATFRSKVKGVYFAILTQAITYGAYLALQQNDLKMGGTNGLNFYDNILGFTLADDPDAHVFAQTRFWLYVASVVVLMIAGWLAFAFSRSGLGRVMLAIRDDETRLGFNGYSTWVWKTLVLVIAGVFAGVAGMLYTPQKSLINPKELATISSIMVVAYVAFGGRATVWGAAAGAIIVSLIYEYMTSSRPEDWKFVLGAIFVLVPLFLPGGLMSAVPLVGKLLFKEPGSPLPESKSEAQV